MRNVFVFFYFLPRLARNREAHKLGGANKLKCGRSILTRPTNKVRAFKFKE